MATPSPTTGELLAKARAVFGIQDFRPGQLPLLEAVLGQRDAVGVLPTGSGKSLVYQLASLFLARPVVVVTPLISLAEDQTDKLEAHHVACTRLDSSLRAAETRAANAAIAGGKLDLVYVTPERLQNAAFLALLQQSGCALLVIDEAHCISQWGHDFRPAYAQLRVAAEALGRPPILALTATATREVETEVIEVLGLREPFRVRTPGERKNLHFAVQHVEGEPQKLQALAEILASERGSALIYCATIKAAKQVHAHLVAQNLEAGLYHGDLHPRVRDATQTAFMDDRYRIIVATKAFGLGIDKPNTRLVVHYQIPDSIESYVQEAGRAGRDGKPARCVLLFDKRDERVQRYFLRNKQPPVHVVAAVMAWLGAQARGAVLNWDALGDGVAERWREVIGADLVACGVVGPRGGECVVLDGASAASGARVLRVYEERRARQSERLERVISWAESGECRTGAVLAYLGDESGSGTPCGHCDVCDWGVTRVVRRRGRERVGAVDS